MTTANKVNWIRGECGGYSAEVFVSRSGGPISYQLKIEPVSDGTFDYWIIHNHYIEYNGLCLHEESKNASTLREAKQKCVKWMQQEIRKIRDDCHKFL